MTQEVIVTCAVTGGHANYHKHPDFPITPEQIAQSCLDARSAGAAIVHIHARNPETGEHVGDPEIFREIVERLRDSGTDLVITVGGDGTILRAVQAAAPHGIPMVGINMGRLGFMTELQVDEALTKLPSYFEDENRIEERNTDL